MAGQATGRDNAPTFVEQGYGRASVKGSWVDAVVSREGRGRMHRYRNGKVAAVLAVVYAALVLVLGVVSLVILLTVRDPILLSGVALVGVTFPLGWLIWWGWNLVPFANPVLLTVVLAGAGLLQAWLIWRIFRGRPVPGDEV